VFGLAIIAPRIEPKVAFLLARCREITWNFACATRAACSSVRDVV